MTQAQKKAERGDGFFTVSELPDTRRASVSTLPSFSGGGYGYGGAAVLTIGDFSVLMGEGEGHALAIEIARRWNECADAMLTERAKPNGDDNV